MYRKLIGMIVPGLALIMASCDYLESTQQGSIVIEIKMFLWMMKILAEFLLQWPK
jgi:hypothetical protein